MKKREILRRSKRAFTLLEILLVVGILGLLMAFMVVNVDTIMGGSKRTVAETFVNDTLATTLTTYSFAVGSYPSTEEGLEALVKAPESAGDRWKGPYLKQLPVDPWGEPYQYECPGRHNPNSYDVWSTGPDKKISDDDIGNWKSEKK